VAGNSGGVLDQVRERAADMPNVACGGLGAPQDGSFADAVKAAVGTAFGLFRPLAELAFQLGDLGRQLLRENAGDGEGPGDIFGALDALVAAALREGHRGVVFVVDASDPEAGLWGDLFVQVATRHGRLDHQPVVVVAGLGQPAAGGVERIGSAQPRLVRRCAALARDARAGWLDVPALTADQVTARLVVSAEAAQFLVSVTGGDDREALRRWTRWPADGVVQIDADGVWQLANRAADHVLRLVEDAERRLIGTQDPTRLERCRDALIHAALIGDRFCVETVIGAMESAGWEASDVTDDLDAWLGTEYSSGLLSEAGVDTARAQDGRIEYWWRYRYLDRLVALYHLGLADDDGGGQRRRRALLTELTKRRPHGEPDGLFDPTIAVLARNLDETTIAAAAECRLTSRLDLRNLDLRAQLLIAAAHVAPTDTYICKELSDITLTLTYTGLQARSLETGRVAYHVATNIPTPIPSLLAEATRAYGLANAWVNKLSLARSLLEAARTLYQALYDTDPTPTHRHGLAITTHEL
jgi:hypothetical protein